MKTEQKIAIIVKFIPCTNTRGSRVGLKLPRFHGKRKEIAFDHSFNDAHEIAEDWLERNGITTESYCDLGDTYGIMCDWSQRPAIFRAFGLREHN